MQAKKIPGSVYNFLKKNLPKKVRRMMMFNHVFSLLKQEVGTKGPETQLRPI